MKQYLYLYFVECFTSEFEWDLAVPPWHDRMIWSSHHITSGWIRSDFNRSKDREKETKESVLDDVMDTLL